MVKFEVRLKAEGEPEAVEAEVIDVDSNAGTLTFSKRVGEIKDLQFITLLENVLFVRRVQE